MAMKAEYFLAAVQRQIEEMAETIRDNDDFVLICHISPDGDAMGSTLAMLRALERLGKTAYAICDGTASHSVAAVLPVERVREYGGSVPDTRVAIALDCADRERMGRCEAIFDGAKQRLVIDHHVSNNGFGDQDLVVSDAAATAEILLGLFDALALPLDREIATCLYVALSSDTGGFMYSNTSPRTMEMGARLLQEDIDFTRISTELFRLRSVTKSRMLGAVLSDFQLHCQGRYACATLDYAQLSALDALNADSEGLVDSLRDVEGVEVAVYVRENAKDLYKVSMRSRDYVDVAVICGKQGGGGHERAAGFTWHGKKEPLGDWLLEEIREVLRDEV